MKTTKPANGNALSKVKALPAQLQYDFSRRARKQQSTRLTPSILPEYATKPFVSLPGQVSDVVGDRRKEAAVEDVLEAIEDAGIRNDSLALSSEHTGALTTLSALFLDNQIQMQLFPLLAAASSTSSAVEAFDAFEEVLEQLKTQRRLILPKGLVRELIRLLRGLVSEEVSEEARVLFFRALCAVEGMFEGRSEEVIEFDVASKSIALTSSTSSSSSDVFVDITAEVSVGAAQERKERLLRRLRLLDAVFFALEALLKLLGPVVVDTAALALQRASEVMVVRRRGASRWCIYQSLSRGDDNKKHSNDK